MAVNNLPSQRPIGCTVSVAIVMAVLLTIFLWPYRLQTVVGHVGESFSDCTIQVNQASGWKRSGVAPLAISENLAYPLKVVAFPRCGNAAPFSAQLLPSAGGGSVKSADCGDTPKPVLSCRLEVPPIASRSASNSYVVRIIRSPGDPPEELRLDILTPYEWRSIVIDTITSV